MAIFTVLCSVVLLGAALPAWSECVDWLNKFRDYGDEELRKGSPPEVHVFAKRCTSDKSKLKLTCLATGFYPKDVMLTIRKYRTSLPEDEIESSGVRPNHDETFQLRKSVVIKEDEKAEFDCFVFHSTLKGPIIIKWDGKCQDCPPETIAGMIGAIIGAVIVLAVVVVVVFVLKKKKIIAFNSRNGQTRSSDEENVSLQEPANASNRSDSNACSSQVDGTPSEDGLNTVKAEREHSADSDSGQESAGSTPDSSPTNSQEAVNHVCEDSSGQSRPAEAQSLLQQDKP
ncbi:H-2 class I histocompatibility antigen, D-37 alpha chain-like [Sinocyclocheilus anshuiensis]|uniref:H-2 class I histocompatibility antigen, D-37 alpha chain-like n=1 Tax=Sinocyclocheilus anshuiensis TaxID=1608454 RepID=UPI0007B9D385|nr:PREDICTED: H-2 class I histocompatibility antigen, D-37 alpha chain-like [Sinocyclocheilus anshuiensis]